VVHQPIECRVLFPCLLIEVRYREDSLRVIAVTDQHVFIGGDRRARESDIGFGFDAFTVLDADRAGDEKRCDHFGWAQFGGPFKAAPGLGVILGQKRTPPQPQFMARRGPGCIRQSARERKPERVHHGRVGHRWYGVLDAPATLRLLAPAVNRR